MSNSEEFKDHISKFVSTVRDLSAWILRSFKSRSPTLMLQLWKSMVITHLDYCSQLWNPHSVSAIQQLEELQRNSRGTPEVLCSMHRSIQTHGLLGCTQEAWSVFTATSTRKIPDHICLDHPGGNFFKHYG